MSLPKKNKEQTKEEKEKRNIPFDKPFDREFSISINSDDVDEGKREVTLSASSEYPVSRYFGNEILRHDGEAIDMSRLNNGANLLLNHDGAQVAGVVIRSWVEDKKLKVRVKISRNQIGTELMNDIVDGIRRNVSIGYNINETEQGETKEDVVVSRWMPFEVSFVGVPADPTVGVGRAMEGSKSDDIEIEKEIKEEKRTEETKQEVKKMSDEIRQEVPQIDVRTIQAEAVKAEQKRSSEILEMGVQFKCQEEAKQAVRDGKSVDEFRQFVLENVVRAKPIQGSPEIGLENKEIRNFSVLRAISAIMDGNYAKNAPMEFEIGQEVAKRMGKSFEANRVYLPHEVASRRTFDAHGNPQVRANEWTAGTAANGGYTVATEVAPMIDILRNSLFAVRAGATFLSGLQGNLAFPRHKSNTWSSYWVAEATAASQTYPTLEQFTLTPKEIAAYTDLSTLLMKKSNEFIEAYIQRNLAAQIALGIDTAIIKGGSTGGSSAAPTKGLLNSTLGINSVNFGTSTLSVAPTWAKLVQMETEVMADNAAMPDSRMAYVHNARVNGKLKTTLQSTVAYGGGWLKQADGTVNGYPSYMTNIMPNNSILFGDWSACMVGLWSPGVEILVDPYSQSSGRLVRLVASQACDYNWRHVESFCKGNYVLST